MGRWAAAVGAITGNRAENRMPVIVQSGLSAGSYFGYGNSYEAHARAYMSNEIVQAAIRLLATSAAEPVIIGRRWRRDRPHYAVNRFNGIEARVRNFRLVQNGFVEELPNHPLVRLMNNPNPYTTRAKLMRFLVMDRYLAGRAYVYKARNEIFGNVQELYRLRPDRVRVILDNMGYPTAYEYRVDSRNGVVFPAKDIIAFDEPNPLDEFCGLAPVDVIMPRIEVDAAMRGMLGDFYMGGGTGPGAILTVTGSLSDPAREEIGARLKRVINKPGAIRETLIIEQGQSTYQRLGLERGLTDAVPKDVNAVQESRIALPFGIPGSILQLLIGYESSSYANKRADWQVLWDITMTPLMSDFDDGFTRSLCPEFAGIDELLFDLGDIRALQEDVDALHERARKNVVASIWSWEEAREVTGVDPNASEGTYLVPNNVIPWTAAEMKDPSLRLDATPEQPSEEAVAVAVRNAFQPRAGRPRLIEDAAARGIWERGSALKAEHPTMTHEQVAARLGVSERTWRRYREQFE